MLHQRPWDAQTTRCVLSFQVNHTTKPFRLLISSGIWPIRSSSSAERASPLQMGFRHSHLKYTDRKQTFTLPVIPQAADAPGLGQGLLSISTHEDCRLTEKRCYIGPLMLLDAAQEVALSCALFANHQSCLLGMHSRGFKRAKWKVVALNKWLTLGKVKVSILMVLHGFATHTLAECFTPHLAKAKQIY